MNKEWFLECCKSIVGKEREKNGIGTLSEKTLHAVLKRYFEPNTENHEIKLGRYYADIVNEHGITEIQTANFNRLREKLGLFLDVTTVTVVLPIAKTKWLCWINPETKETTNKRKSPKTGSVYEAFYELYKIKSLLSDENLTLCIVLFDSVEYRYLNGWSKDKKRGSVRQERIPVDIAEQIYINSVYDYQKLIPCSLPEEFTAKDFAKASKINVSRAQTALNVLNHVKAVKRIGKKGNAFLYKALRIS